MANITSIEEKTTSTNKPYRACTLGDGRKVNVWSDHPLYAEVSIGGDIPDSLLYQKGQYWNISNPAQRAQKGAATRANNQRSEQIKEAQDRKEQSITFFNATNAAMQAVTSFGKADFGDKSIVDIRKEIRDWRDWFIKEHEAYKTGKTLYPEADPIADHKAQEDDVPPMPADW